jgi:hypothetical protein
MQRMPSIGSNFTPLERAVLAAICENHAADRTALEAQLSTATGVYSLAARSYADCLEGYSYNESTTGIAFERAGFEILQG